MTDGGVLAKWKDYQVYFGGVNVKTARARLLLLKIRIPRWGAPMMRRDTLDKMIDEKAVK